MKFIPKIKKCSLCGIIYSSKLKECPVCSKYITIKGHKLTNKFVDSLNKKYRLDL